MQLSISNMFLELCLYLKFWDYEQFIIFAVDIIRFVMLQLQLLLSNKEYSNRCSLQYCRLNKLIFLILLSNDWMNIFPQYEMIVTMYLYHVLIINIRHKIQTVCFYLYWHTNDKENLRKRQKQKMRQNISFCQIHYFVVLKVTGRRNLPLASIDIIITLSFLRMNG